MSASFDTICYANHSQPSLFISYGGQAGRAAKKKRIPFIERLICGGA
jgi:hypothetical protein